MEVVPAVPNPDAPGSPLLPVEESRAMLARALSRFYAHDHTRPADPDKTGTMAEEHYYLLLQSNALGLAPTAEELVEVDRHISPDDSVAVSGARPSAAFDHAPRLSSIMIRCSLLCFLSLLLLSIVR